MSTTEATYLAAALLGSFAVIAVLLLILYILFIIAYWKMFTKAGEKGWKSIIPIYNLYIAYKIAWKNGTPNFWIFLIATVVGSLLAPTGTAATDTAAASMAALEANPVIAVIVVVADIIALVWHIRFCIKQAHAYSKGTACGVLSIFIPNIMALYYGFATSAVYRGQQ